jgi:predicted enzyme related to lactoylglutathione lyase
MKHGQFLWCDVMTTDTKAAAAFYSQVVGWTAVDGGSPDMDYTVLQVGGVGVAGVMDIPDEIKGVPPAWMTYILVDDVEAAAKKLVGLGGALHKGPITVPGIIQFAVVEDPQGTGFLIARGLRDEPMPPIDPRSPGAVGWHELFTPDLKGAIAFYEEMFGWTLGDGHDMGPMGIYQLFKTPGSDADIGGMMTKPAEVPVPFWNVYFSVDGIEAGAERVRAAGGSILMGPHQVPGGDWIVQCKDPQGAFFCLFSPTN